ncbi:hypothetical protein Tco_1048970 [Tanacetum coccineum]
MVPKWWQLELTVSDAHMDAFRQQLQSEQKQPIIEKEKGLHAFAGRSGDYIRLKLGNGENTRFWVDNWYEGGVIKELFPRMFALELNKNATVSSKLNAFQVR